MRPGLRHRVLAAYGSFPRWARVVSLYVAIIVVLVLIAALYSAPLPQGLLAPMFMALAPTVLYAAVAYSDVVNSERRLSIVVNILSFGSCLVSLPYLYWFSGIHSVKEGFFAVSAQVIPVLLLALLVDVGRADAARARSIVGVVVYAFFGEGLALTSEASPGVVGRLGFAVTASSLVVLALALSLELLWNIPRRQSPE